MQELGEHKEYNDPVKFPGFTCTRLGYIPAYSLAPIMPSAKWLYRHRSGFSSNPNDRFDNMWNTLPEDGEPWYTDHSPAYVVPDAGYLPP